MPSRPRRSREAAGLLSGPVRRGVLAAAGRKHRVYLEEGRRIKGLHAEQGRLDQRSLPPVYAAINRLEKAGILREATGRQRGKLYVYDQYLSILNEGTEDV